jgi:hypothetical protein
MSVGKCDCGNIYIYLQKIHWVHPHTHAYVYNNGYSPGLFNMVVCAIILSYSYASKDGDCIFFAHRYVMTQARCSHQAPVLLRRRIATQPAASRLVGAGINCQGRVCQVCWETSLPGFSNDNPRDMPDMDQEGYTGPCFYNTYFIGHGFGLIAKT